MRMARDVIGHAFRHSGTISNLIERVTPPMVRRAAKDRIDQQYMERLERLLPLRRSIQKSAA
jgi:hypothetical protein